MIGDQNPGYRLVDVVPRDDQWQALTDQARATGDANSEAMLDLATGCGRSSTRSRMLWYSAMRLPNCLRSSTYATAWSSARGPDPSVQLVRREEADLGA